MFISVEGLDGAGTTSLVERITEEYPSAITTSEPTDRQYGQLVRENLSAETDPRIDFYLFMADRIDHIKNVIEPADEMGQLVVSDRYADSTRAYQPVAMTGDDGVFESQFQAKNFIERTMNPWNYEPDLTIYLDISVDTALDRADCDEKYEKRAFLEQVRDNYEALVDSEAFGHRIVRVDAEQSKEEVFTSALGKIDVAAPDRL